MLPSDKTVIKAVAPSWAAGIDRSHPGSALSACRQCRQPRGNRAAWSGGEFASTETVFILFAASFSTMGKRHQKKSDVSLWHSRSLFLYEKEASYRYCHVFRFQQRRWDPALRKVKRSGARMVADNWCVTQVSPPFLSGLYWKQILFLDLQDKYWETIDKRIWVCTYCNRNQSKWYIKVPLLD